jgi:hypothetical protein
MRKYCLAWDDFNNKALEAVIFCNILCLKLQTSVHFSNWVCFRLNLFFELFE